MTDGRYDPDGVNINIKVIRFASVSQERLHVSVLRYTDMIAQSWSYEQNKSTQYIEW